MSKYLIVVESPLQLINSIEYCYAQEDRIDNVVVFYFLKKNNPVKNEQAKRLLKEVDCHDVVYLSSPSKKGQSKYYGYTFSKIKEAVGWIDNLMVVKDSAICQENNVTIVGFGAWLAAVASLFENPTTVIVDGGASSLRKNNLSVQWDPVGFFFPRMVWISACFMKRMCPPLKKMKKFDIYFSSYEKIRGVVPGHFLYNAKKWQLSLAAKAKSSSDCFFVSCNSGGKLTDSLFYNNAIKDFISRCDGVAYYYPRGNEPVGDAIHICETTGVTLVEPVLPFELYLLVKEKKVPQLVASLHSTAIDVVDGLFGSKVKTISYIDKSGATGKGSTSYGVFTDFIEI